MGLRQAAERHRGGPLRDRQRARGRPLPVHLVHGARHRVAAHRRRRRRRSVVGQIHRQPRRVRRRRRALGRPVVDVRQVAQGNRGGHLRDRQRAGGDALVVRLVHRARHGIAPRMARRDRRAVVGDVHHQTGRDRRRRRAFRRAVVEVRQVVQGNGGGNLRDHQRADVRPLPIRFVHRPRHGVAAHLDGQIGFAVVGDVHRQSSRRRRRRCLLLRPVVDVRQVVQRHRRRALADRQRPRSRTLPACLVHRARHRVAAHHNGPIGFAIIGEIDGQPRRRRRRGGRFRRAVVGLRQVFQRHRRHALADRERTRGRALPIRLVHRARHRVAAHGDRLIGRAVVREFHRQPRRHRRCGRRFGRAVVGLREISERDRRRALRDRQRAGIRALVDRVVDRARHGIAPRRRRRGSGPVVGELHRQSRRHRRRRRALR